MSDVSARDHVVDHGGVQLSRRISQIHSVAARACLCSGGAAWQPRCATRLRAGALRAVGQ